MQQLKQCVFIIYSSRGEESNKLSLGRGKGVFLSGKSRGESIYFPFSDFRSHLHSLALASFFHLQNQHSNTLSDLSSIATTLSVLAGKVSTLRTHDQTGFSQIIKNNLPVSKSSAFTVSAMSLLPCTVVYPQILGTGRQTSLDSYYYPHPKIQQTRLFPCFLIAPPVSL